MRWVLPSQPENSKVEMAWGGSELELCERALCEGLVAHMACWTTLVVSGTRPSLSLRLPKCVAEDREQAAAFTEPGVQTARAVIIVGYFLSHPSLFLRH